MKTIRQNTFETNSSSTHAYTINVMANDKPTFKPLIYVDKYTVTNSYDESDSWNGRATLCIRYGYITTGQPTVNNILEWLAEFLGVPVTLDERVLKSSKECGAPVDDDEALHDYMRDEFYSWCRDGGTEDFISDMNKITSDKNLFLSFVFSESSVSTETYYDG